MSGAVPAAAATKGLRGVAQGFLAPELRALTERVQGFENLNKSRFDDVNRRFAALEMRMDRLEARMDRLEQRMERLEAEIVAMPDKIGLHIDRLISSLDLSNRLAAVERDRTPRLPTL